MERIQKISRLLVTLPALLGFQLLAAQTPATPCQQPRILLDREPAHRDPGFTFAQAIAASCHRHFGDQIELYPASLTLLIDLDATGTILQVEICHPQGPYQKVQQDLNTQFKGQQLFTPAIKNGRPVSYQLTYRISCLKWSP